MHYLYPYYQLLTKHMNKSLILNKDEIDIVIYHGWCSDGFGAAFIIWHFYSQRYGVERANSIKFIPAVHPKIINPLTADFVQEMTGKNIIICDFAYKFDQLVQIFNVANGFMILDHHKTAEKDLLGVPDYLKIFDMKRSGCGITWDYFYPNEKIPKFLAHIQDRDIWTQDDPEAATYVPHTAEFVAYFYEQKFDFELWETYLDDKVTQLAIDKGTAWLEYKNICIDRILKKASYVIQKIDEQFVIGLYVNSAEHKSDIGNQLFDKIPFGDFSCVWDYDLYKDETSYSLRSTDDRYDVSKIAGKFGGGGHRNASGKTFPGLVPILPLEKIDDFGILTLLFKGIKGSTIINGVDETYTLFKIKEFKEQWLQETYMSLIKRKCNDSLYIVFEKESDCVSVVNDTVLPLKNYNIFYNEKAINKAEKQLQFLVYCSKDFVLTIDSTKDFDELFSDIGKKSSEQDYESGSESESDCNSGEYSD